MHVRAQSYARSPMQTTYTYFRSTIRPLAFNYFLSIIIIIIIIIIVSVIINIINITVIIINIIIVIIIIIRRSVATLVSPVPTDARSYMIQERDVRTNGHRVFESNGHF